MNWNQFFKEWRLWVLIIFVVGSIAAIGPHYAEGENGEIVIANNINKGLDLKGGARVLTSPEGNVTQEQIEQIVTTLETRISAFGLQEIEIRPITSLDEKYIQIEMAGASTDQLKRLIEKQGNFEARIDVPVAYNGTITLGSEEYTVRNSEEGPAIDDRVLSENVSLNLASGEGRNVSIRVKNITDRNVTLSALAFSGSDVRSIRTGAQYSQVTRQGDGWKFQFQVIISVDAAERFNDICKDLEVVPRAQGKGYLSSRLDLYLDDNLTDSLQISAAFRDQVITEPSVSGSAQTQEEARVQMNQLKSILRSGALPVPIEIVSVSSISPSLGEEFVRTAFTAIFAAVVAVSMVIFLRYKNVKIALPILITGLSEVLVLLAFFSSGTLNFISISFLIAPTAIGTAMCFKEDPKSALILPLAALFTLGILMVPASLDLAAIAGIIAAVGTGVDDQVIITDEGSRKKFKSLKARIKRAFFIIFTSAASTIGAMLPLTFVGAGAVQGFAFTAILGVLVGVSVTRPAYAKFLEYIE